MTTLNKNPNLLDLARRTDPDGKMAQIVELLHEDNELLEDITFIEGNLPTGHKTTVRTGLPTVAWRKLNYGVPQSKSQTQQVTDVCGMLEAYAEVDKKLADLNGNTAEFRLQEDRAFIEAMNQELMETIFYGDVTVDPEKFTGFHPRYSTISDDPKKVGFNVIDGGGTGNKNTSIWIVVWSPTTVHGIIPKGSKAGFDSEDKGQVTLTDEDGGKYEGYRSHYTWDAGLCVRDWRYVGRIANVDVSQLKKDAEEGGADLVDLLTQLVELPPNLGRGRAVIYCCRTIRSFLRRQIKNSKNVHIGMSEVAGKRVVDFDGIAIKRCDALLQTEARIV